ncbi:MAG: ABC transporter substrate-binding protein [Thermodesulfobacteriota bacterium]
MKTKSRVFVFILLVGFIFFITETIIQAKEVRGVTDDTIKIGVIADLTGPIANIFLPVLEGYKNYMQYINNQGGIHGRKIKNIYEDSRYTIPGDIAAFKKLVFRDNILAMFGASSTGGTIALFPQIEKLKVPTIAASQAESMYIPPKRYVFCTAAGYSEEIKVLFDFMMKDLSARNPRVGIVYPDVEFGKTNLEQAKKSAKHYGVDIYPEVLNMGALEASSQVMLLKRDKVTHVIVVQVVAGAICFLREARKFKLNVTLLGTGWTCNEDVIKGSGEAANNYYGVNSYSSWYDDTPGMARLREITLKLNPKKKDYSKNYSKGWLCAMILEEGMKRAGRNLDSESLVAAMETFKNFDTGGVSGYITYGTNERMGGEYLRMYKADLENNKLIPVGDWRKAAH